MIDLVRSVYLEDAQATLAKYKTLADRALERISDEHFFATLDPESNSLAILVKHMSGNLLSRWTDLLTTDGEKPDRDRDAEFVIESADTRDALMRRWEHGWSRAISALGSLVAGDLERTIHIRGEPLPLVVAINRQLTHAAYHVGQIVLLAKRGAGEGWESLSIPRGESRRFNAEVLSTADRTRRG